MRYLHLFTQPHQRANIAFYRHHAGLLTVSGQWKQPSHGTLGSKRFLLAAQVKKLIAVYDMVSFR